MRNGEGEEISVVTGSETGTANTAISASIGGAILVAEMRRVRDPLMFN
jgi:hypothetical protein